MRKEKEAKKSEKDKGRSFFRMDLVVLFIICILMIVGLFILPKMVVALQGFFGQKVDPDITSFNRLDYLKICISILSPILTFMVFRNTLKLQRENERQRFQEKRESERKENYQMTHTDFYKLIEIFTGIQRNINVSSDVDRYAKELISASNKRECVEKNVEDISNDTGHYLRAVHRVIKTLNERLDKGYINYDEYHMFMGIFRTQFTSNEFYFIEANVLFSHYSKGLAVQIIGSGFFDGVNIKNDMRKGGNVEKQVESLVNEDENIKDEEIEKFKYITSIFEAELENVSYRKSKGKENLDSENCFFDSDFYKNEKQKK